MMTNPVLEEIIKTQKVKDDAGNEYDDEVGASEGAGRFLQEMMRKVDAKQTLEVGFAHGTSALYVCDALIELNNDRSSVEHIVIDPEVGGWNGIGERNIKKAGYEDIITAYYLKSHEALPKILDEEKSLDFAFIDGWHTFDYKFIDFFYIDLMLKEGGIIVIDDPMFFESVRKLVRYILTNRHYEVVDHYVMKNHPHLDRLRNEINDSRNKRLIRKVASKQPRLNNILKHELVVTYEDLGFNPFSKCVALKKTKNDDKNWDFHKLF